MPKFIIDAGHGNDTPGKRSGELLEWRFNRHVMKYVTFELDALSIPYYVLVPEDYDVPLRTRSAEANKYAAENGDCILLSIHGNAYSGTNPERVVGIETWYHSPIGAGLASIFQEELVKELRWRDRGLKKGNFWILKKTSMPAVLVELGFYTNPEEREKMLDAEYQYRMGTALTSAIKIIIVNHENKNVF